MRCSAVWLIEAIVALEYSCKAITIEEASRSGQPEGGAFLGVRRERRYRKVARLARFVFSYFRGYQSIRDECCNNVMGGAMRLCNCAICHNFLDLVYW